MDLLFIFEPGWDCVEICCLFSNPGGVWRSVVYFRTRVECGDLLFIFEPGWSVEICCLVDDGIVCLWDFVVSFRDILLQ